MLAPFIAACFIPFFDLGVLSESCNLFGGFFFTVTGLGSLEVPAEEGLGVRGGVRGSRLGVAGVGGRKARILGVLAFFTVVISFFTKASDGVLVKGSGSPSSPYEDPLSPPVLKRLVRARRRRSRGSAKAIAILAGKLLSRMASSVAPKSPTFSKIVLVDAWFM